MQRVVLTMILSVFLATHLVLNGFPGAVKFLPEMLSAVVALYVVAEGTRQRFQFVQPKYWIFFSLMLLFVICGILANEVASGPIIAGARQYLRALPFFFLPAIFAFSEKQIKRQLILVLMLCLTQLPFAGYQRYQLWLMNRYTGDLVIGTLTESGTLTLIEVSAALVVLALFLRKRLTAFWSTILFFLLLLPTTINETKITIIIVPLGLLVTLLVGTPRNRRALAIGWATTLLVAFVALLIPIYDFIQEDNPYPQEISLDLLTDNKRNYLEAKDAGIGATSYVGRKDAVAISTQYVADNPIHLAFGLGIGNSLKSSLGKNFSGRYADLFEFVSIVSFSDFILELGLFGTTIVFILHWLILKDALFVAKTDRGILGAFSIAWSAVGVIIFLTMFYKKLVPWESVSYLYWYFSGLIAAQKVKLQHSKSISGNSALSNVYISVPTVSANVKSEPLNNQRIRR